MIMMGSNRSGGSEGGVARRKSLLEKILDDRRRAKAQQERAAQRAQAEYLRQLRAEQAAREKARAAAERKAAQQEREAQRRAEQQERARKQATEKAAAEQRKQQLAAERAVAAAAARRRRAEAEQARSEKARARTELEESVTARNEALDARVRELSDVLTDRPARPTLRPPQLEAVFNSEGPEAFCARLQEALEGSTYPAGVPGTTVVMAYRPEARELILERELPRADVIPAEAQFRIVKGEARPVARKDAESRHLYGQLLARTALRTLSETFAETPATLVDSVVLNGWVTAVDKTTGKAITPHLISVQLHRDAFEELVLDSPELDPEACLRANNALISPHPHDLIPVKPLLYYDIDRFKTISGVDYLVDLDSRLDLLSLTPTEFENLIKQLFEARGLKSWQTVASNDDGIDAVAVNEDPVLGGLAIIQAKRYAKAVPYESITALAGVMHHKNAAKGLLVTTSWVGAKSHEFARDNGRIQIIEGRELKHLLADYLNMDVLISLPVVPRGWNRADIA
jgi:restriction system protein